MPKLNQRGVIHLLVPIILLLGLIVGVYLVTSGNPLKLFSRATVSPPVGPETSFTLVGPDVCTGGWSCIFKGKPQLQEKFEVKVYARSDIETANLFKAEIAFPKDLVEVKEIITEGSFIQNWAEDFYDNETGEISLTGGVPTPGYKTQQGGQSALMATITFKAKALGKGTVSFTDSSAIYSNLNNINILTTTRPYDISVEVAPSPTPSPSPVSNFGKAINLNGSSDCTRIGTLPADNLPDQLNFDKPDGSQNFTVEGWFKVTNNDNLYYLYATERTSGGNWAPAIEAYIRNQRLNFSVYSYAGFSGLGPQAKYVTIASNSIVTPNIWHHFAGIREGYNVRLLLDGNLEAQGSFSSSSLSISYHELTIGCQKIFNGSRVRFANYFPGEIDEIRVSNIARYATFYSVPSTPFGLDSDTVGLWRFNGDVSDASSFNQRTTSLGNIQFVDSTIGQTSPTPSPTPTPTPKPGTKGDGNKDGKINLIDLSILHSSFPPPTGSGNPNYKASVDMNDDGKINTLDFLAHRELLIQLGVIRRK